MSRTGPRVSRPLPAPASSSAAGARAWAPDLRHTTVTCGHFMAEEAPGEVVKALRDLLGR